MSKAVSSPIVVQENTSWPPEQDAPDTCHAMEYYYKDLTQKDSVRQVFVASYIVVTMVAFIGNILVIWTVLRNKYMRTVTNYYILNLSVSDFLVSALVMPLKALEYTAPCHWEVFTQKALCPFVYFVLPVFVFVSVFTLVAISIERYFAIVHPFASLQIHSKSRTRKIILATWVLAIIVASPYLFCRTYSFTIYSENGRVSRQICTDRFDEIDQVIYGPGGNHIGRFRRGFFLFLFVGIFLVPLLTIVVTSVRITQCLLKPIREHTEATRYTYRLARRREENKRKVARMMIVVAMSFLVSWSPFYVISFVSQVQEDSFLRKSNFIFCMLITHLLGFINSCVNPIVYNCMNDKFRRSFRTILSRLMPCFDWQDTEPLMVFNASNEFRRAQQLHRARLIACQNGEVEGAEMSATASWTSGPNAQRHIKHNSCLATSDKRQGLRDHIVATTNSPLVPEMGLAVTAS